MCNSVGNWIIVSRVFEHFFFCFVSLFSLSLANIHFERSTPRWHWSRSLANPHLTNFKLLLDRVYSHFDSISSFASQYLSLSLLICILNSPNESLLLFLASSSNSRTNTQNFIYIFTLSSSNVLKFHVLRQRKKKLSVSEAFFFHRNSHRLEGYSSGLGQWTHTNKPKI